MTLSIPDVLVVCLYSIWVAMINCSICCYLAYHSMQCAYLAVPTFSTIVDLNMVLSLLNRRLQRILLESKIGQSTLRKCWGCGRWCIENLWKKASWLIFLKPSLEAQLLKKLITFWSYFEIKNLYSSGNIIIWEIIKSLLLIVALALLEIDQLYATTTLYSLTKWCQ